MTIVLWNQEVCGITIEINANNADNYRLDNRKKVTSKCFEYKPKIIGSTPDDNNTLETEVVVLLLNCRSNFWRSLDNSFINCEIKLELSWSKDCIISETWTPAKATNPATNPPTLVEAATSTTGATKEMNKQNQTLCPSSHFVYKRIYYIFRKLDARI